MMRRINAVLLSPRAEWARIASESRGTVSMLATWVLPLALLPFAAVLLRYALFTAFFGANTGFALAPYLLADAAAQYAFIVAWVFVVSLVANALAPRFEGQRDAARALRVVGYALTPAFVASVVIAVPIAQYLAVVGLFWSAALLRLGLPPLMGAPERRSTAYAVTVAVIAAALALLILLIPSCAQQVRVDGGDGVAGALVPAPAAGEVAGGAGKPAASPDETLVGVDKKGTGAINLDDLSKESIGEIIERTVDREKMRELGEAAKIAAESAGKIPFKPAEPSMLGELMPAIACGQPRESLESKLARFPKGELAQSLAGFGQRGSGVTVRMEIGDNTPRAGGLGQLRLIMPSYEQRTSRGYQRRRSEGDVYIDDRWDAPRKEAWFAVLIAGRFVVHATATGVDEPGCAEQAVRAVDWAKLAAMAGAPVR